MSNVAPKSGMPRTHSTHQELGRFRQETAWPELVKSSIAGDRGAAETLFEWIRPAMVRYCRSRIGASGSASAEDVAQEICVATLKALTRYRAEPESFLPFVYGIAAHKVTDHYRRSGRDLSTPTADIPESVDVAPDPEQTIMAGHMRERVGELLGTLPPQHREILVLRLIVGLSSQETAAVVGLTPSAVRVTQHRALVKLRNALSRAEWE